MAFHLNGYSNFHDDNQDWIVSKIKSIEDTEAHTEELAEAAQNSADASQASADASQARAEASQASAEASQASAEAAQHSASDSQESAEASAASELSAKNYADNIADPVSGLVTSWLDQHVTPTTPVVDNTLTISGAAADAKVTGNKITAINNHYYAFNSIPNTYISRDDGSELSSNGWTATDFIPVPPNAAIIVYPHGVNFVWGAKYDSSKTYVEAFGWDGIAPSYYNDTNNYIYFRTSGRDAEMANIEIKVLPIVDSSLTKNGYPANAKAVGDELISVKSRVTALETDMPTIPSYYESQLLTKEATIRDHFKNCALNGDGIVFLTDTHFTSDYFTSETPSTTYNANNSIPLIMDIIKKCGINKIIFGGDLVNSAPNVDTMLLCMAAFRSKWKEYNYNLRYCIGNHEYFTGDDQGQTLKPTPAELYGAGIKYNENVILGEDDNNTYYFDNAIQKVRYFVIPCGRDTEVLNAQASWIMNEFQNIPSDYRVILIGHAFLTDSMTGFRGQYKYILEAFDALKAKTQYWYNGVTYDYRNLNNVTPVCAITGHTHIDGSLATTGGIPCICTTCDSFEQNYELVDGTPTHTPRTQGAIDEQAFDVFQFDFTNRKIYTTRIGYGSNREFTY